MPCKKGKTHCHICSYGYRCQLVGFPHIRFRSTHHQDEEHPSINKIAFIPIVIKGRWQYFATLKRKALYDKKTTLS